jgi:hypothetical protein
VENNWKLLTSDLEEVRNHQQEALRRGEGGHKSASGSGTMKGTSGTTFTFHLCYFNDTDREGKVKKFI